MMKCTTCNEGAIEWKTYKCTNPNCPNPRNKARELLDSGIPRESNGEYMTIPIVNETFKMKLPSTSGTIREVAKNYRGKQYPWWKFW